MRGLSTARLYGAAIALVSGIYSIVSSTTVMMGVSGLANLTEVLGIGGWIMLIVGIVVLIHGIVLLTPIAERLGAISGPLMVVWAFIMLVNQGLLAMMPNWGMDGSGMGVGMDSAMPGSMSWDPGMVAISVLMLISGLIMWRRAGADSPAE